MNRNKLSYWINGCKKYSKRLRLDRTHDAGELEIEWACAIAVHYFSQHYHSGQWSDLYSVSCQSEYNPGPMATFKNDMQTDPLAWQLYRKLSKQERNRRNQKMESKTENDIQVMLLFYFVSFFPRPLAFYKLVDYSIITPIKWDWLNGKRRQDDAYNSTSIRKGLQNGQGS